MTGIKGIEALLCRRVGIDPHSIGRHAIDLAVNQRMRALQMHSQEFYFELISASDSEFQSLVDEVTVPESWFFRHPAAFEALANFALKQSPSMPARKLRVLSFPCSTGEEPCSIVITLLRSGLPRDAWRVEAADINRRSLVKAARGLFPPHSFRETDSSNFRKAYFTPTPEGDYLIDPVVRDLAHYFHGNILDANCLAAQPPYDVIFCRNLLIYLDQSARDRALSHLVDALVEGGLLLIGHAEAATLPSEHFRTTFQPGSFAFEKRIRQPAPRGVAPPPSMPLASTALSGQAGRPLPVPPDPFPRPPRAPAPQPLSELLPRSRQLADAGRLTEAEQICQECLRRFGPSAELFYILGLVKNAAGAPLEAARLYEKAVFLNPECIDAMFHLSLIASECRDQKRADHWKNRMKRVLTRTDSHERPNPGA